MNERFVFQSLNDQSTYNTTHAQRVSWSLFLIFFFDEMLCCGRSSWHADRASYCLKWDVS